MRERIYSIINDSDENDRYSTAYDTFMVLCILVSIIPLALKEPGKVWDFVDLVCAMLFLIDYLLRWVTADYKYDNKSVSSFLRYPFSPMAIIDLLSILPSFTVLNPSLRLLRLFRLARALRIVRVFKLLRYSKSVSILKTVIKKSKESLITVASFAVAYIIVSALVVYNVEPDTFKDFFEAVYWATVSLTTVGYGDIYPTSDIGRIVTMVSSMLGIAVVALPASIITAEYVKEVERLKNNNDSDKPDARFE